MKNITLLSLAIAGSLQRSPFLHFPSSTKPCFNNFKNINAQHFFSSFLITQSKYSRSTIEGSIFNYFITSNPVLSFSSRSTAVDAPEKSYYGNSIPKEDNPFYITKYNNIKNCKFMSITDNTQEQLLPDVGLCIYSTINTTVDTCYFFAILSYRSGSAILFDQDEEQIVHSAIKNSVFKSMTQTLIDFGNNFLTGGAISQGRAIVQNNQMIGSFVEKAVTEQCCFEKIRLLGEEYNGRQLGVVTYFSNEIQSSNLNFTDIELGGQTQRYGAICVYLQQISENELEYINIFESEFTLYGAFSIMLSSTLEQNLTLSFSNFINNSAVDDQMYPVFGIEHQVANETNLFLSNIQCNLELPFFGISQISSDSVFLPVEIELSNSVFKTSASQISNNNQYIKVIYDNNDHNKFSQTSFDADITNNAIKVFGYIATSHFSPSDSFSNPFVQDSASYYDLSQDNPITAGVLATIFGIISFIVFIFLLCVRRSTRKRSYEQVGDFNDANEFQNLSENEDDSSMEEIMTPVKETPKSTRRSRKNKKLENIETNDIIGTQDEIVLTQNEKPKELDEKTDDEDFINNWK